MNKIGDNIIESVNFISEEDLMVQELDKRLSFDMVPLSACIRCVHCERCENVSGGSCGVRG